MAGALLCALISALGSMTLPVAIRNEIDRAAGSCDALSDVA